MRTNALIGLAVLLCSSAPAHAEWLLASPRTRVVAGQPVELSVVRDPADAQPIPDRLEATLEAGERRVRVELVAKDAATPDAFRRDYVLTWPVELAEPAVIQLADRASSRLLLIAEAAVAPASEAPLAAAPTAGEPTVPTVQVEPALTLNEPMYFLFGASGDPSARFQLSFKYRIFDAEGPVVGLLPFLGGLHFGYTQTALWDLVADSRPFRDTSYRPSLFYRWNLAAEAGSRSAVELRTGYEHESNGRNNDTSRSIDTLFASADWRYFLGGGPSYLGVSPKVWAYLDREDNSDIYRYRSYGELGLRYGRDDGWLARLNLRRAMGGVGSTQLDLSYPLRRSILSGAAAYLHFQVFDGVGETLLDYNRSNGTQFRIGFSILR